MTGTKHLPDYVHQHIIEINDTWGAAKAFRQKAKIPHDTFKRLVENGYARTVIVQRVLAAYESEKCPAEITGDKIIAIVRKYQDEVLHVFTEGGKIETVPKQLQAWLMFEHGMLRREIASLLGYSSMVSINNARVTIRNEMDTNREFEKLVFRIEAELEGMR